LSSKFLIRIEMAKFEAVEDGRSSSFPAGELAEKGDLK
jgi:hypothetical protein